jgi:hypothetical protein
MALSGHHNEGAVVTVYLDTKVASFTTIPLISPSCDGLCSLLLLCLCLLLFLFAHSFLHF